MSWPVDDHRNEPEEEGTNSDRWKEREEGGADTHRWNEAQRDGARTHPWNEAERDGADDWDAPRTRWPLGWRGLYPRERWLWFNQLWCDVCMLRERYGLPVRSGWWENEIQLEALAALSAWVSRYDSGEWDDPPGKLALLYDLENVTALLRDGSDPFSPGRDRGAFESYLVALGCQPPQGPERGIRGS